MTTPCTNGHRHKWEWIKNVRVGKFKVTARGTSGAISLRGLYKCQCGSSKLGVFNPNGNDLRGMMQVAAA